MQCAQEPVRWFISDLHLSENTPKTLVTLLRWLETIATPNCELYLLGDIFEYWVGDDYIPPCAQALALCLKKASQAGLCIFFMPGNRDFLLGKQYLKNFSGTLLPDPYPLQAHGKTICLSHGDQLCTDDLEYQAFRLKSRNQNWQNTFLNQTLEKRITTACTLREHSKQRKATTACQNEHSIDIMDVNNQAVQQAFSGQWPNLNKTPACCIIIHGHTHRSAHHPANHRQNGDRWVLSDWDFENSENSRGNTLKIDANDITLINIKALIPPIDSGF
jgi:UDP-2,3-diacylglucosamine hydrolase